MDTAVVINQKAGTALGDERTVRDHFTAVGWPVVVYFTRPQHLRETLLQLVDKGMKTIIVGGGDGSLSSAAATLAHKGVVLGVLPMGTFNFFANDINMPADLTQAVRTLREAKPQWIDLGQLNDRIFLNKASIGLHPFAIETRRAYQKKWGLSKRIAISLALMSSVWHSPNLRLTLDSEHLKRNLQTPFLVVGNNEFETGLDKMLNRDRFDAGCLGLYYAHKISRFTLLRIGLQAFFRWKLKHITELETLTTQQVEIHLKKKRLRVAVDGEVLEFQTPLRFQILPKALQVLLPPTATA